MQFGFQGHAFVLDVLECFPFEDEVDLVVIDFVDVGIFGPDEDDAVADFWIGMRATFDGLWGDAELGE